MGHPTNHKRQQLGQRPGLRATRLSPYGVGRGTSLTRHQPDEWPLVPFRQGPARIVGNCSWREKNPVRGRCTPAY